MSSDNSTLVRTQLERILRSQTFVRSERLSNFLRFIVEKSLEGSGEELKEQVLAGALYGRADFDTATDPIVRVDARRLRDKLREYYAGAPDDPVVISLPKGSYRPTFDTNGDNCVRDVVDAPMAQTPRASTRRWLLAAGVAIVFLTATTTWLASRDPATLQLRVIPLASLPGKEGPPSLSPDGNFVAFSWSDAEQPGPADIWVKAVDSEVRRRLTDSPLDSETNPAWSPDGREIAFVRSSPGVGASVFIISALGAGERKVSDSGTHVGWAADSKSVLIRDREAENRPYGIFQIDLETLKKQRVTQAAAGSGDWQFATSPDGGTLAWVRYDRPGISDIYLMPMQGGEPRRLTDWSALIGGLAWTPDGREIVYSVEHGGPNRLFRVAANLTRPGRGSPIEGVLAEATHPSISRPGSGKAVRLAFQTVSFDIDLQMMQLPTTATGGSLAAESFLTSTRIEGSARFSPNGDLIAFVSYRSGTGEIWLARRDGSNLRRLTNLGALEPVVGAWSPDGDRIAFTASVDGNTDIYSIAYDGGEPVRLTSDRAMELCPSYSSDGRWIYFSRNLRGAEFRVWRIPVGGGEATQITNGGGFQPQESSDGRDLYYLDGPRGVSGVATPSRLMKMPVGGGEEVTVLTSVPIFAWSITDKGILFVTREPAFDSIDLYRFEGRKTLRVGRMGFRLPRAVSHAAFSRDGTRALATRLVRDDTDLMLIDDFR